MYYVWFYNFDIKEYFGTLEEALERKAKSGYECVVKEVD